MTRNTILTELVAKGYNAEPYTKDANNVLKEGIIIKNGDKIAPVIYVDEIIELAEKNNVELNDVVEHIIHIYENSLNYSFKIENFTDIDYITDHVRIGLQRTTCENIVKHFPTEFDGEIESYLFLSDIDGENKFSVKITTNMMLELEKNDLSENELWKIATLNTMADTKVMSMSEYFSQMGIEVPDNDELPLYIFTNSDNIKGAGAVLNHEKLRELSIKLNAEKLYIIPSSIHECLVTPVRDEVDIEGLTEMVMCVNDTQVEKEDQLGDRAYIYTPYFLY